MTASRTRPSEEYVEGAPDLAVEVVSPSNTAEDLQQKIEQHLETGARAAVVVYPKTKTVEIRRPGQPVAILGADDALAPA